jgi:predicted cupin superfamily sugar epimerase
VTEDKPIPDTARALGLSPHPEGGWYKRTWRSEFVFEVPGRGMNVRAARPSITSLARARSPAGMLCVPMTAGMGSAAAGVAE